MLFLVHYLQSRPYGLVEQYSIVAEDFRPFLTLFFLKVSGDLEIDAPDRLPVGAGGGRGPYDPRPVGVGGGGMPNGLWGRASRSILSLWDRLLRPDQEHDERPERTHPDRLTIIIHTTKGDIAEANGNEIGGGGGWRKGNIGTRQQQ